MKLHSLHYALGSKKKSIRVGRGIGSGRGGTSKRGSNGDKSRSGYSHKFGFEGGQTPLYKKIPIVGFKNINKKVYKIISIASLEKLINEGITTINAEILENNGLIKSQREKYKILCNSTIENKEIKGVKIFADAFSKSAIEMLKSHNCECLSRNGDSL